MSAKAGVKRPRTSFDEQQSTVHVTYKDLTRLDEKRVITELHVILSCMKWYLRLNLKLECSSISVIVRFPALPQCFNC